MQPQATLGMKICGRMENFFCLPTSVSSRVIGVLKHISDLMLVWKCFIANIGRGVFRRKLLRDTSGKMLKISIPRLKWFHAQTRLSRWLTVSHSSKKTRKINNEENFFPVYERCMITRVNWAPANFQFFSPSARSFAWWILRNTSVINLPARSCEAQINSSQGHGQNELFLSRNVFFLKRALLDNYTVLKMKTLARDFSRLAWKWFQFG